MDDYGEFESHQSHANMLERAELHGPTASSYWHLYKRLFGWHFDEIIAFALKITMLDR